LPVKGQTVDAGKGMDVLPLRPLIGYASLSTAESLYTTVITPATGSQPPVASHPTKIAVLPGSTLNGESPNAVQTVVVGVAVTVTVGVSVGVFVAVAVGTGVLVAVGVGVLVAVGVGVFVAVEVGVAVCVPGPRTRSLPLSPR